MSYVCLWTPRWSTAADVPADLVASLLAHAPRVAVGTPGDTSGLVWGDARGLHGGQLAEAMLRIASDYGFENTHAGVARTPVAAEVAARYGAVPLLVVPPGQERTFLAPRPVSVLAPSEPIARLLAGLGIETCGALAALDAGSIEVRFGAEGVRLWQRAGGEDHRFIFILPIRTFPSASVEWVEYELRNPERLLFVLNALAGRVCTALVARGERARVMSLVVSLGNRTQRTHPIRSSRPSAEQKRWMRLIREALDTLTLPEAVTGVMLRVESVTGNDGTQGDLFDRGFASAPAVERAIVQMTDDQGDVVVAPANSRHPLVDARTTWRKVAEAPVPVGLGDASRYPLARPAEIPRHPAGLGLTLQLLPTPRIVTVETEPRRDHAVPTRYLDGAEWHDVVEVAGPDRVSGGQWSTPYAREYFRCVREDGMMVWLFHDSDVDTTDWFLHGWWD